jgi:formate hydrogenlyase subunit 3/multisubunit Na+/H+ antiporter MnhD subunit
VVYVGRAFQRMWWEPRLPDIKMKPAGDRLIAPTILITLCVILGLWGEPLIQLADVTTVWMLEPSRYIEAVLGTELVAGIR